jgi:selenocysteine lyase/cysteine desulfurase
MTRIVDVERARAETPGCERVLHFDNAGASLMPQPVLDRVLAHLGLEMEVGGYAAADAMQDEIEAVYEKLAGLVNGRPSEIALVENATVAWQMAFHSIPFVPGDRILTAKAAYASNYIGFLQMARRRGVTVEVIPDDGQGQVSVEALREMMDERVRLVAITHVPTNGGLVNPAAAVGRVAQEWDALYLLDACQSAGQMPIDVGAIGCDMLSATGRKWLRGPRGTGFLFVREGVLDRLEPPFLDLRGATWVARDRYEMRPDARRFENWEKAWANVLGLGTAVAYAQLFGLDNIWARVQRLASRLRGQLQGIPGVTVRDKGAVQCGIVTFTVEGMAAAAVQQYLRQQQINVTTSTVRSTRLDMEDRQLAEVVRASIHYFNTEEEIARFCGVIGDLPEQRDVIARLQQLANPKK